MFIDGSPRLLDVADLDMVRAMVKVSIGRFQLGAAAWSRCQTRRTSAVQRLIPRLNAGHHVVHTK